MTHFFRTTLFLLGLLVILAGCSNSIIVNTQSLERPECASEKDPLTVQIFNDSQFEISNFSMETTGCRANFAGLWQGETTCPIPVEPFYADFDYMIYIARARMISNEFTREEEPAQNRKLITEGNYKITFKVDGKGYKLSLIEFKFEKL